MNNLVKKEITDFVDSQIDVKIKSTQLIDGHYLVLEDRDGEKYLLTIQKFIEGHIGEGIDMSNVADGDL